MNKELKLKWRKESATISHNNCDCKIKLLYDELMWLGEKVQNEQVKESKKFKTLKDAYAWSENILLENM